MTDRVEKQARMEGQRPLDKGDRRSSRGNLAVDEKAQRVRVNSRGLLLYEREGADERRAIVRVTG